MNIMVFDVPAETGGALTILNDYYNQALGEAEKNKVWYFVVSTPELMTTGKVKVLRFPWVKKTWFHRLFFDYVIAPKLVKKYNIEEVLSLQNVIIPRVKVRQTLYLHQALPFVKKRYSIVESPLFWVYQNIISKFIFVSLRKAHRVIVQTDWMKNSCLGKVRIEPEKITIIPPKINLEIRHPFEPTDESIRTFFYPANGLIYKNHKLIVEAVMLLKQLGFTNYKVIFTLTGNENKHIATLYEQVKEQNLPIFFVGSISRNDVLEYYTKSILIFPSYIETFGLPMLEARLHQTPIFASDTPFSHEILDGFERATYFDPNNPKELASLMVNQGAAQCIT